MTNPLVRERGIVGGCGGGYVSVGGACGVYNNDDVLWSKEINKTF
ncbi:hypothetical protein DesyoDRAFT_3506 [Desulfosporosinus youngiae DSM 17734]|uniref:Uncharacterized protein n=1 Tax=Desulfosporosinus youngiae DSM 17734 TaxID=768710 RepID=H5XWK5_9FIRM|nr:hypothetical protein DesyoDRAFT_3506 [Desulfosporosinus youngiae DSM 17734]